MCFTEGMHTTQDNTNKPVRKIADLLTGLPLVVQPNGDGYRIQCTVCGWSHSHGPVQGAMDHAASH